MQQVSQQEVAISPEQDASVSFELTEPRCLRLLVVADPGITGLTLQLADASAKPVAETSFRGNFAVLDRAATVCANAGSHRALVRSRAGNGTATLRVLASE